MKDQILKIAKVKSEKEFYKKFPTEEAFMAKHGKQLKKAAMGTKMVQTQLKQLTDFGNPPIAQNGKGIIPFEQERLKARATIMGVTPEELMKQDAIQATQSSGGGGGDILGQLASFITPEMIAGLVAKDGKNLPKAYGGDEVIGGIPQNLITGNTSPAWTTNYNNPLGATTAPMAIPGNTTANSYKVDYSAGKPTAQAVGKAAPKAGLDFKSAGISALSALPSLIGSVQAIGQRSKNKGKLKVGVNVSDLVRRAAESRPINQPNQQQWHPWDTPAQPGQLGNSYGQNTNYLSAANGTQIQNTYAPTNTLYDDLGYEPLNESDVKQYGKGGKINHREMSDEDKAQFGIEMLAGPAGSLGSGIGSSISGGGFEGSPEGDIGSTVGSIAGSFILPGVGTIIGGALGGLIGGIFGGDEQRQMKELQTKINDNTDLAAGQSTIQGIDQQFSGSRKDGGWVSNDWQPQVITKFGDYDVKDLLKPPHDADMLRAGGTVGFEHYTPPSAEALQTYEYGGQMAMGGDLQVHQGKADTISYNPFLPKGGETVMFKGPSHANGGMDISYGQNGVEVEGGEPGVILKDGGNVQKDENLVIYGNIKFDELGAKQLGDPKAEGKKIKNYMNDVSKDENKQNNLRQKSLKLIDETDLLKMGTVQAINLGTTAKLKVAAQRKIDGAAIQEAYNKTAKEYGYKDAGKFIDDVRKGSVKQLEPIDDSETAQNGTMLNDSVSKGLADMKAKGKRFSAMKSPTSLGVIDPVTQYLADIKDKGKAITSRDFTKYGQVSTSDLPSLDSSAPTDVRASTAPVDVKDIKSKNDKWKDILGAVSSVIPMLRPSNAEPLDPSQLSGEMLALASNQLEGVQAQSFQPMLDQPYDISLQDQINMIDAQTNAAIRTMSNDPSAQSQIMANAIEAKNKVLGEQFRINQANKAGIYAKNRDLLNQSQLQNLQIFDKQYERQSQAKSNTKAQAIGALNSINSKIAQNKLENKQLGVYENLYGYRFGPNGQAYNLNGPAQFNMQGSPFARTNNASGQLEAGYEDVFNSAGHRIGTKKIGKDDTAINTTAKTGAKIKARNSSIVKAVKSL